MSSDEEQKKPIFFKLDQVHPAPYSRRDYQRRLIWRIVEVVLSWIWLPKQYKLKRFFLQQFGAKAIGAVSRHARIWHPWLFSIGKFSVIAEQVTVYNLAPISIGAHSTISQGAHLCAGSHDHTRPDMPLIRDERAQITIGDGVWICTEAYIGPGVTIGNNSIVGARAVVVKDVPDNVIVAGNPARIIRQREI
ncbi:MAG: putative colanic acid biosynthesis acetyltransferase [Cohaesibacter sp.]|jgi:putative colanic acid biosynthesis acetyltransferase WcaF|nr:putative colanic acid biosynthesis acetyltransferase [Cohaesibacter sp.]